MAVDYENGGWFDHENQDGGGVLDLIARRTGRHGREALEWLKEQGIYQAMSATKGYASPRSKPASVGAIGKIVATYDYPDENGKLIFQVVRFDPKDFRQRRPAQPDDDPAKVRNGWVWEVRGLRQVPYRLPEVLEAIRLGGPIWIAEGEKDADNLWNLGIPATCNPGGVGKWSKDLSEFFRGADAIIVQDNDPQAKNPDPPNGDGKLRFHPDGRPVLPGQDHAQAVARSLFGLAARVRLLDLTLGWPELHAKGDVSDCIDVGATAEHLRAFADSTPDWSPQPEPASEIGPWENPNFDILEDSRGILPEFPTEVLDPEWGDYVERTARAAGVTPAHVAVPLIGIISGVIGCSYRIRASRAWSEPCAIWCAVVGYSGTGKTPGIDVSKRALAFVEKQRGDRIADLQRKHETRAEAAKAAQKKWKDEVEEAIENGKEPPHQPLAAASVAKFVRPRLYITDTTVERAAVLLQARPSGLVLIRDELSGLFANMSRYTKGSDREFWLESWNGKHYVVERMSRDPVIIDHLLIAVVGGLQPDKLVRSFEGDDDGMYARMCFSWPSEADFRALSNDCAEYEPIIVNALLRLVDELPIKAQNDEFVPGEIRLSQDAEDAFVHFLHFLHQEKSWLDGREREWWIKGGGQVIRLAGTLALMSWAANAGFAKPQKIERPFVEAAIRIWRDYFWPHSRAALCQLGITKRHATHRRVLKWIRASKSAEKNISVKEVRREALGQSLDAKQTEAVLEQLEQEGWLKKETTPTSGRARHRWIVNERLFDR
jgi:hypothetical protein